MARQLDACRFVASASGSGDFVVASAALGAMTPATANAVNGAPYKYRAVSSDLSQWEIGAGTYTVSSTTLSRTTVLYNSAGTGTLQSGAGSKISFTAAPTVAIVLLKEDTIATDEANSFSGLQQTQLQQNIGLPGVIQNYLTGLGMSTAGSSSTLSIAAGCAADTTNADYMVLSALSKTTSAWAVGSGNGGLDTGTIGANTWYHFWLIKRTDTGVVDVLCSLSATAPTMPTNYTLKRLIGSWPTDGSSKWQLIIQDGDQFMFSTPATVWNVTNPGTAAVTRSAGGPTGRRLKILLSAAVNTTTSGDVGAFTISDLSLSATGQAPNLTTAFTYQIYITGSVTQYAIGGPVEVMSDTSQNVRTQVQISTSACEFVGLLRGWIDTRGK